jgi:hypothetical protein
MRTRTPWEGNNQMVTYCNNCGGEIPLAAMIRARWKARYCKTACREEHKNRIGAAKRAYREQKGACPTCGRHRAKAREQLAGNVIIEAIARI